MTLGIALLLALASLAQPTAEPASAEARSSTAPVQEKCKAMVNDASGQPGYVDVKGLGVLPLSSSNGDFSLPPGAPTGIHAIACERESIVPAKGNYKVLMAGFPLFIYPRGGKRVLVLEIEDGKFQFEMFGGEMTAPEHEKVLEFLDTSARSTRNLDASDAGRSCSDNAECEGMCEPPPSAYVVDVPTEDPRFPGVVVSGTPVRRQIAKQGDAMVGVCSSKRYVVKSTCIPFVSHGRFVVPGPCEGIQRIPVIR